MGCESSSAIIQPNSEPNSEIDLEISQAKALEDSKKFQEAHEFYQKLSEKYPGNWKILNGLGDCKRLLGKYEEANVLLLEALRLHENWLSANSLSISYRNLKKYGESEEYAKLAIRLGPKEPKGYNSLGMVRKVQNRLDEALEHFLQAIEVDESYYLAYENASKTYQDKKQAQKALDILQKFATSKYPKTPDCFFEIALVYKNKLNQQEEAINYLRKCLEVDPNYPYAYNTLGNIQLTFKRFQNAIKEYRKAVEFKTDYPYPYNGMGNAFYQLKQYQKALEAYKKSIQICPTYSTPYSGQGDAYKQLGQLDKALESYRKSIELNPKDQNPYNGIGNVYKAKGNLDESIKWMQKSIQINPHNEHPYNGIGNALCSLSKHREAIEYYQKAIKIKPNFNYPYNGMGNAYFGINNLSQAQKWYKKCIQIDPDYPRPYINLGNLYERQDKYEQAKASYQKGISLEPNTDSGYNGLGILYSHMKNHEEAAKYLRLAIKNNPNYALGYINLSLSLIALENYPEAFKMLKQGKKIIDEKASELDVFGGCRSFITSQLSQFEKEIDDWEFKSRLGYLAPEDKKRINDMRKSFEDRFKTIFGASETNTGATKLDDLDHNFFLILQRIKQDSFKLLNDAEIAKISFDLCKEDNDNFNIMAFLFCKFFWNEKNIKKRAIVEIESQLQGKLDKLCKLYPPSTCSVTNEVSLPLKASFREQKINLLKDAEYFDNYMYLVKEIEKINDKCQDVLVKFKQFVFRICSQQGGYNSKANLKLPNQQAKRFKVYIRIMEKMFKEIAGRKTAIIETIQKKINASASSNMQTVIGLLVQTWTDEISTILKDRKQKKISTQCFISDFVRGKSMFRSLEDIVKVANRIIDESLNNGFSITEIDNRLGKETKDLVFKICIDGIVCELQLAMESDADQYHFSHCLYQIKRSPLGCIFGSYLFLSKFQVLNFYRQAKEIATYYQNRTLPDEQERKKEAAKFLVNAFTQSL